MAQLGTEGMEPGQTDRPLITVVDDDVSFREALAGWLESFGFNAMAFESAAGLLQSDCLLEAACLIVDVEMPGMSGLELQAELNARGNATPLLFITSRTDVLTRDRAIKAGARGLLTKPFDRDQLLSLVRAALG
jgi:FixJ family two-component response regulator